MRLTEFDYELPQELVAGEPLENRSASRLLVVDRTSGTLSDHMFSEFLSFLDETDVLVVNNTRVFPARIMGRTDTGANVEIMLIDEIAHRRWRALARPGRRLRVGKQVTFSSRLRAVVTAKNSEGTFDMEFETDGDLEQMIDEHGRTPLPPYIKREAGAIDHDRERYQTVYASRRGAIAAPTAGLHFTHQMLEKIREKVARIVEVTLHVGYGTFEPVRVDDLDMHRVLPERYELSQEAEDILNSARSSGHRIAAVGTTTTRALETNMARYGRFQAESGMADLTISPGYSFAAVDAMLTNFHLPMSSLLVLVSTFGGHRLIMDAYRHAVAERYRFYSYGDCMFIC